MRNNQCLWGFARFAYRAPSAKERHFRRNRLQTAYKFLTSSTYNDPTRPRPQHHETLIHVAQIS